MSTSTAPAPGAAPDLLYSEAEDDLRAAVRALLTDRADVNSLTGKAESGQAFDPALWRALAAEMGLAGLLVPEKLGGQGATHREAAVVLEELGRAVTPLPYLTSAVVATEALLACDPQNTEVALLLGDLASGRRIGVLVLPFTTAPGEGPLPTAVREESGTLTGRTGTVADAAVADVLLVPTATGLYAVDTAAPGVTVTPLVPLDLTRPLADVELDGAAGRPLADPDTARAALGRALLAGAGLLASEQWGLADWCLTATVQHTRQRHQFNRPIGSFQALKHRLAHLWLETASARAAARAAADALAAGSTDTPLTVAVAQSYCAQVAVHAAEECVQLHGGIGMTWEHPAHLYLKRAKADQLALGSAGAHRDAVAVLAGLPGPGAPPEGQGPTGRV